MQKHFNSQEHIIIESALKTVPNATLINNHWKEYVGVNVYNMVFWLFSPYPHSRSLCVLIVSKYSNLDGKSKYYHKCSVMCI